MQRAARPFIVHPEVGTVLDLARPVEPDDVGDRDAGDLHGQLTGVARSYRHRGDRAVQTGRPHRLEGEETGVSQGVEQTSITYTHTYGLNAI